MLYFKWINCKYNDEDRQLIDNFIKSNPDVKSIQNRDIIFDDESLTDDVFFAMIETDDENNTESITGICSVIEDYDFFGNCCIADFYLTDKCRNENIAEMFISQILDFAKYHCQQKCFFMADKNMLDADKDIITALRNNHFKLTDDFDGGKTFARFMPNITDSKD